MPIKHDIKIAGETYIGTSTLKMNGANSEEGKTIEYICPEWDNLSFDDTTPILGTHTTDKDGFKTVTVESDDLNAANIIESATIFGVKGAIPINDDQDLVVSGRTVSVAPGYYPNTTSKNVQNGNLTLTSNFETDTGKFTTAVNITEGYLTSTDNKSDEIQLNTAKGKTIYPSMTAQSAIKAGTYALGDINVAAMEYASGSLGGDATNGKATPVIRYDSAEGIKTIQPPGSDYITIGASVRTEPASYTPAYNLLTAGYIGTSLKADVAESIPVEAEEDKVIYIETDDGTTITPSSTEDQTIALTGKLMQGDIVVKKMPEGTLSNIFLEDNKDGTVSALMAVTTPGYVDNTQNREAELALTEATLSWSVGTVPGGCEAKITNEDNIRTVSANHNGDYYTIKATAIGDDGEAGLNVTNFTPGYLSTNPIAGSSYVSVPVASDEVGKEIHIPKATLSANGATVSITEAGYLPAGESQTVQNGAYIASARAAAKAEVSATGGNVIISTQPTSDPPNSGYYFKVTGMANATATSTAQITTAGYLNTGSKSTQDDDSQEATAYYTIPEAKLSLGITTAEGSCKATLSNDHNIATTSNPTGTAGEDYFTLHAKAIGSSGSAYLNTTLETPGYLKEDPDTNTSGVTVVVKSDDTGKKIHIPKATFTTSGAEVTVKSAGYIPTNASVGSIQTADRAPTEITVEQAGTDVLIITANNNQETGYVEGSFESTNTTITLTANGPTVTATATDGTAVSKTVKEVSRAATTFQAEVTGTNEITLTASNDQSEGYTTGGNRTDSATITQSINGPTVTTTVEGKSISATLPDGKVEIDNATIEFDAIVNGEVQTGDYGRPYYNIEVQQGSENTSVSATVTQSGYVTAGKEIDRTPLGVNVSGVVFQSQIEDPRSITTAGANATIGYQQEVQIGAGYYPYSRIIRNGVEPITRAQTTIGVSANDTTDKMVINATNNQTTGYVIADLDANKASTEIQLIQGTPSISSTGVISATATMASTDGKSVSQNKTLQLTTKGATTITPSTTSQTVVEAGVYTTGEIKVAAMPTVDRAPTTIGAEAIALNKMKITASNDQATGYVEGSDEDASLEVELTTSGRTVTATAGKTSITQQVASGSVETPTTTITAEPTISIEDGVITASVSTNQNITPSVTTPGYITSGTAGTVTVSGSKTKELEKNSGGTYTPGTQNITVGKKGDYLTGSITIAGDLDLAPYNIKEGITIFGIAGTYTGATTTEYKLNGLWTFDETRLNAYAPSEPITQEINFYIHAGSGSYGSSITAEKNISYGAQLTYDNTLAYSQSAGIHTTVAGWQGQNFSGTPDTIEFTSEQYVSAVFYNWFTSVATQASGVCTLQASGYPTSAYVFYYNGASSVSMAEVNPGASDIAVPCDRIYIIGSVQCSLYSGAITLTPTVTDIGDVKIQEFNIPSTLSDATVYINY